MDQDQEKRRVCKFCNKSFSNGKMLGGHMRSHGSTAASVEGEPMVESSNTGFEVYGLRENPRKSWRSVQESVKCEVCGKEFGSLKSLYGHMRLHPPQERKRIHCKQCGRLFWSPKSLSNHMRLHCKEVKGSSKPDRLGAMSLSDSDTEIASLVRRKRSSRLRYKISATPDSSFSSLNESVSVSGFEIEQEVEDVAMCLIMMSKGQFDGFNASKRNEKSEGGHVSYDDDDDDDDDDAVKIKKFARMRKFDSRASDSEESSENFDKGMDPTIPELENESRGGFQCRICNKTFLTHQSLGGHQTSHRATKRCEGFKTDSFPMDEQIEFSSKNEAADKFLKLNCIQDSEKHEMSGVTENVNGSKEHRCGICFKVFSSGQALGGHKRAHLGKADEEEPLEIQKGDNYCGFDINLPYMLDAEETGQDSELKSWWGGSGSKHEPLLGLIAH